jgi:hypothetical protein
MARPLDKTLQKLGQRLAEKYRPQLEEKLPPRLADLVEELRKRENVSGEEGPRQSKLMGCR